MLVTWGLWANVRYRYGILMALTYDLWDHYLLRFIDGVLDEFPAGFMSHYTHQLEWLLLEVSSLMSNGIMGIRNSWRWNSSSLGD